MAYNPDDPLGIETGGTSDDPLGVGSVPAKFTFDTNDPLGLNASSQKISAAGISDNTAPDAPAVDLQPSPLLKNHDIIAQPSNFGVAARTVARGAVPMLAGAAVAPAGAALGRFAGAAAGARIGAAAGAFVPVLGETGVSEGIGAVIGGLIGGIGSFVAAQQATKAGEQAAADAINPSANNPISSASESQDVAAHPVTSELTNLALLGKPNPFNLVRAARTISTDAGQAALKDLFTTGASADGYKAWQASTDAATQKSVMNVLNVAQNGGINAVFNAVNQVKSGNYSFPELVKSAAEGALFNEPWIHAKNPATKAFDDAANPQFNGNQNEIQQPETKAPVSPEIQAETKKPSVQATAPTTIIKGIVATPIDADTHAISVNGKDAAVLKFVDTDGLNAAQKAIGITGWEGAFMANDPTTQKPTIYINRQYMDSSNPIFTHETTHLLESMGLVTPKQMDSVIQKYGQEIQPEVIKRYQQFHAENGRPEPTPDEIRQETFANLLQGWHANDNAPKITWIQRAINFVRGIVGLDKTGEQHAQDILAGKFKEPTGKDSLQVQNAVSVPPEEITKPDPNWRVTVQPDEVENGKTLPTGYVQIDDVSGGVNKWSSSPEKLAQKGIQVPDFSKLPKGQYTYVEAVKALDNIQPLNSSAQFSVSNHEDMTPEEKLSASPKVRVSLPSGATHLRVTDATGKSETIPLNKFNDENPVAGRDVQKATPVAIKTSGIYKGQTVPVKGAVDVSPQFSVVKKDQTETPEFKRWFEGSKVVDENGKPLVVYHGAPLHEFSGGRILGDFTTFDRQAAGKFKGDENPNMGMDRVGSFFSDQPGKDGAEMYSGSSGAIYPAFLSIRKPWETSFENFLKKGQALSGWKPDKYTPQGRFDVGPLREWLKKNGNDGIKFTGIVDSKTQKVYVALEPSQIKSAIGNSGTFDHSNPDIRFSVAKKDERPAFRDNILEAFRSWPDVISDVKTPSRIIPARRIEIRSNVFKNIPAKEISGSNVSVLDQVKELLSRTAGAQDQSDWIGLEDFLKGKTSVTKSEVEDFVRANQLDLKEAVKGVPTTLDTSRVNWSESVNPNDTSRPMWNVEAAGKGVGNIYKTINGFFDASYDTGDGQESVGRFNDLESAKYATEKKLLGSVIDTTDDTKFEGYQTPGGSNYRELLLTLPLVVEKTRIEKSPEGFDIYLGDRKVATEDTQKRAEELAYQYEQKSRRDKGAFKSSHFDEPNIVGHIRFNERESTTAENPNPERTMHLEELQSDAFQLQRKNDIYNAALIEKNFDSIIEKMKQSGILKIICD